MSEDEFVSPPEALARVAESYVGVIELGGDNRGPEVEEFQKSVNGKAEGQSWCMDFVQYCVEKAGAKFNWRPTLFKSEGVLEVWQKSRGCAQAQIPKRGLIAIWIMNGTQSGHCGIVISVSKDGTLFETVEGNTGPGKDVIREGDGVYEKTRHLAARSNMERRGMRLLGFLDAFR